MNTIRISKISEILDKVQSNILTQIIFGSLIFLYFFYVNSFSFYYSLYFVSHLLITCIRFFYSRSLKEKLDEFNYIKVEKTFFTINLIYAISWGFFLILPFILFKINSQQEMLLILIVSALISSAMGTLSLSRNIFLSFILSQISTLLAMALLTYDDALIFSFQMILLVLFTKYLLNQQKSLYKMWEEITIQKENQKNLLNSFPGFVAIFEKEKLLFSNEAFKSIYNDRLDNLNLINKEIFFFIESRDKEKSIELTLTNINSETYLLLMSRLANNQIVLTGVSIQSQKDKELLIQTQNALIEQSSKLSALGEVSGGIAHEINNPLAIISLSSQSIKIELGRTEIEESKRIKINNSLNKIETMVDRVTKIIKALRTFARDASNDSIENVNLNQLIEETFSFCESKFKNKEIYIDKKIDKNIFINCRKTEISQVLFNLLNNSFEASILSKKLDKFIKISTISESNKIKLIIEDSGDGIPESFRNKLMQPFFTTKEIGKGTGLGLSVSNSIIRSHGGDLYFDFNKENTTVIVEFPI